MSSEVFVRAAQIWGIDAMPIPIRVSIQSGVPGIYITGMSDNAAIELRAMVRQAIRAAGFTIPRKSFSIELPGCSTPTRSRDIEFAIAAALLELTGQIPELPEDALFFGSLDLEGHVRPQRGAYCVELMCAREGYTPVMATTSDIVTECPTSFVSSLSDLRNGIPAPNTCEFSFPASSAPDFADIPGNAIGKTLIAAAVHARMGILLIGNDRVAEAMAQAVPSILPEPDENQVKRTMGTYSAAAEPIIGALSPYRRITSDMATGLIIGGGRPVYPGEVSLATSGVLHIAHANSVPDTLINLLRTPARERSVRIVRVEGTYAFPADCQMVATAPSCPCGHYGDPKHECTCTERRLQHHYERLRRLTSICPAVIHIANTTSRNEPTLSSEDMRALIEIGAHTRAERGIDMPVDVNAKRLFETAAPALETSRTVLDMSRALADIRGHHAIQTEDMSLALATFHIM